MRFVGCFLVFVLVVLFHARNTVFIMFVLMHAPGRQYNNNRGFSTQDRHIGAEKDKALDQQVCKPTSKQNGVSVSLGEEVLLGASSCQFLGMMMRIIFLST